MRRTSLALALLATVGGWEANARSPEATPVEAEAHKPEVRRADDRLICGEAGFYVQVPAAGRFEIDGEVDVIGVFDVAAVAQEPELVETRHGRVLARHVSYPLVQRARVVDIRTTAAGQQIGLALGPQQLSLLQIARSRGTLELMRRGPGDEELVAFDPLTIAAFFGDEWSVEPESGRHVVIEHGLPPDALAAGARVNIQLLVEAEGKQSVTVGTFLLQDVRVESFDPTHAQVEVGDRQALMLAVAASDGTLLVSPRGADCQGLDAHQSLSWPDAIETLDLIQEDWDRRSRRRCRLGFWRRKASDD